MNFKTKGAIVADKDYYLRLLTIDMTSTLEKCYDCFLDLLEQKNTIEYAQSYLRVKHTKKIPLHT